MAEIDANFAKRIAGLARLHVDESEVTPLADDLNRILLYIEKLNQVDTAGIEALSHVHGQKNRFRTDEVTESNIKEEILALAPDRSGSFVRVPLIIDQDNN